MGDEFLSLQNEVIKKTVNMKRLSPEGDNNLYFEERKKDFINRELNIYIKNIKIQILINEIKLTNKG